MEEIKNLGNIPDLYDSRDYQLATIQPDKIKLPKTFCLMDKMPTIQAQLYGTCTAHAVDGVIEYLNSLEYGKPIKTSQKFLYHATKEVSNWWDIEGDSLRNTLKAVCKIGVCKEGTYPDYPQGNYSEYVNQKPPAIAYKEAQEFRAKTYWSVPMAVEAIKQAFYRNKRPLATGMKWFREYWKSNQDGYLELPKTPSSAHAFSYIGWETAITKVRHWFRNSFGNDWGYNGYFYMPEAEFSKHYFFNHAWIILDYPFNTYIKTIGILRRLIALYQKLIDKIKGR